MIKKKQKKHGPFSFLLSMDAKKILFGHNHYPLLLWV
jgi:hypothetical protein